MNLDDLRTIVARGESETLEFKRSTGQLVAGMRTVCGMLNGLGGFVLFGVGDNGAISGQNVSTQTLEQLANELRKIEPPAFPEQLSVTLENGNCVIALRVTGGGGPFTYDGRPYQRVGPTTSLMPRQRYERALLERLHATQRWENEAAVGFTVEDLDHAEITRTIDEAIRRGRMGEPGTRNPVGVLAGLNLIRDGHLLNAAVVLFGRSDRLMPTFPQCLLRMARFRGTDKSEFIDNRQEVGNAFDLFVRAQRFLRDHLPVAGRIVPNLFERIDDPLYPLEALREALANALCHRDYAIGGGAVDVALYDDRLEIQSTGPLPFDITPEDLTRPHQSRPWNPLIAQAFYRRGISEAWGRGTLKMVELTTQAGLAAPEFESNRHSVLVRFRPTSYIPPLRVTHDLSDLQRAVLDVLARNGATSLKRIREQLPDPVPVRTVQDNLQIMRQLGLVDLEGTRRTARWMLRGAPLRD